MAVPHRDFIQRQAVRVRGVQGAFEADPIQGHLALQCAVNHDRTNQIIGDDVPLPFLVDPGGGETTEPIHWQGGFKVIPIEFALPAPGVEGRPAPDRPRFGGGEGGDQGEGLAAPVWGPSSARAPTAR